MPGARKHSAAERDREADGGAEAPERGAERAREDMPAAALPRELCAGAAAGPRGWLPAPVKPRDGPPLPSKERWSFSHLGKGFPLHPCTGEPVAGSALRSSGPCPQQPRLSMMLSQAPDSEPLADPGREAIFRNHCASTLAASRFRFCAESFPLAHG